MSILISWKSNLYEKNANIFLSWSEEELGGAVSIGPPLLATMRILGWNPHVY